MKPIKYKNYVIRKVDKDCLIAIPSKSKCFYAPIQLGLKKDLKELKGVIYDETKPKKR